MYRRRAWLPPLGPTCCPEDLADILTEPTGGVYVLPVDPYNEVYPNLYISDGATALCHSLLRRLGITHVVNTACGKERRYCLINTSERFYRISDIKFLGIETLDLTVFPLFPYFDQCANFIHEGLQSGGKVLVHCAEGISRSATITLAYLMIKQGLTAQEAVRQVRRNRAIIPNAGFLRQLCDLNDKLAYQRNGCRRRSSSVPASPKFIAV